MSTYEFTLVVDGLDVDDSEQMDRLFEAGFDDTTFSTVDGVGYAEFTREADSVVQAIDHAIEQIRMYTGLEVLRVEPDDLVTATDIAEAAGVSRQYIDQLIKGERQDGTFPPPVTQFKSRSRLWRRSDVLPWLAERGVIEEPDKDELATMLAAQAFNGVLTIHSAHVALQKVDEMEARHLAKEFGLPD